MDLQEGDKVAAVGAAGLIAAAFGAKFGKAFLVAALLLLKKFWFVLLAIPVVLWRWFRSGSTREAWGGQSPAGPCPTPGAGPASGKVP